MNVDYVLRFNLPYTISANSLLGSMRSSDKPFRKGGVRIWVNILKSMTKNHTVLTPALGLWPSELLPQVLPVRSHAPFCLLLLYLFLCGPFWL